jgi:hydrogenase expression/formation protein HypC
MCLAVPGKIVDKQDMLATVDISGVTRKVSLMLLPEAKEGDFVLIHAGFAIQRLDEAEAQKTLELFKELEKYAELDA